MRIIAVACLALGTSGVVASVFGPAPAQAEHMVRRYMDDNYAHRGQLPRGYGVTEDDFRNNRRYNRRHFRTGNCRYEFRPDRRRGEDRRGRRRYCETIVIED